MQNKFKIKDKKDNRIYIRISNNELKKINDICTKLEITISEYARSSMLDERILLILNIIHKNINVYLKSNSKIGNNINQIAKKINSNHAINDYTLHTVKHYLELHRVENNNFLDAINTILNQLYDSKNI